MLSREGDAVGNEAEMNTAATHVIGPMTGNFRRRTSLWLSMMEPVRCRCGEARMRGQEQVSFFAGFAKGQGQREPASRPQPRGPCLRRRAHPLKPHRWTTNEGSTENPHDDQQTCQVFKV